MKDSDFIEKVPFKILTGAQDRYSVIILNTTGNNSVINDLSLLYPQSQYRVGVSACKTDDLAGIGEIISSVQAKIIILAAGSRTDEITSFIPDSSFSASLISSGSYNGIKNNVLDKLLSLRHLSDFSHLGYQQYKYDPEKINILRDKYFETLRLGIFRESPESGEPLLRNKEYIFFDTNSIRIADFPGNPDNSPNGLYAEEACILGRYIGMNQSVKVCSVFGFDNSFKAGSPSSQLLAEIIWHIAEGVSASVTEDPSFRINDDYFLRKIVNMGEEGQEIVFITSSISGRWWMEIPDFANNCSKYVACSFSDYQSAYSGEVPVRWIFFFQKINPK